jgi:predicted ATPase/class 3 adenylate cyclase/DNA-binding CsgD family transcriptional regulator
MDERMSVLPTGTVTFLLTDIQDSTVLWEADPTTMRLAADRHLHLLDTAAAAHGGVRAVEQGAGDSTVFAFTRASDAVAAAVDAQRALGTAEWQIDSPLLVRVAVHVGEVDRRDDGTYVGAVLNRCSRLCAAAHGGQLLVSGQVADLVADSLPEGVWLDDLGRHRLRGVATPMRVFQVAGPDLPSEFPPLRTLDGVANNLPVPETPIIGRAGAREDIRELLRGNRLVTLTGSGGCGKTRLALEAAGDVIGEFEDGIWWVDLGPISEAEAVDDALARALAVRVNGAKTSRERALDSLRSAAALVVFDNCEHLLGPVSEAVAALLSGCPGARVLATSREPLGVAAEVVWRVPSLALPDDPTTAALESSEAGALLLDRIRRQRPDLRVDAVDAAALTEICRRLDGIPLALELAAGRVRTLGIRAVAAGLGERFRLLAGGTRNALPRQRTLEASVLWSHHLLSAAEQVLLRRLSVFSGGFTLSAAEAVAAGDNIDAVDVIDLLVALVDRSMIVLHEQGERTRYGMLETIRQFAYDRLLEADEATSVRDRHLHWFEGFCREAGAGFEGPDPVPFVDAVNDDADNVRAALAWAAETGQGGPLSWITGSLCMWWQWRGHLREARAWLRRAEELAAGTPADARVHALWCQGWVWSVLGPYEPVRAACMEGLELARGAGDRRAEARVLSLWGMAVSTRDSAAGLELIAQARTLCEQYGERYFYVYLTGGQAAANLFIDRHDLAWPFLVHMAAELRADRNPELTANMLAWRAWANIELGRWDMVRRDAEAIRDEYPVLSDVTILAIAECLLVVVDAARGRAAEARVRGERLLARFIEHEEYMRVGYIAMALSCALIADGDPAGAIDVLKQIWAFEEMRQAPMYGCGIPVYLHAAQLARGDVAAAKKGCEELIPHARSVGNVHAAAQGERFLGAIARSAGEVQEAEDRFYRALDVVVELGYPQRIADLLEEIAGLDLDTGRPARAARLFGAAATVRAEVGLVHRFARQQSYESDMAALGTAISPDELEREWSAGTALALDEAVDLARRGRGERSRPKFGWDSLTPTEQKVADLVTRGLNNPDIAEQLFMGRETVKSHVSSVLRKLGARNRTELATLLTAHHRNTV